MTLHLALAAGGQKSLLIDRRPSAAQQTDPRALALSHGARELLEQIHSWPARAATQRRLDFCRFTRVDRSNGQRMRSEHW